jgi:hypothetical protein
MRRQTYEPVPVGYAIQNAGGADASQARQYDVDRTKFEEAGGRVAATSADAGARDAAAVYTRVTLGELPVGQGTIRIAGGLLPQPTTEFDHPLGLSPHGLTYTGYIVVCNLLGADCSVRSGASIDRPVPGGGTGGGTGGTTGQTGGSTSRSPSTTLPGRAPSLAPCVSGAGFRTVTARAGARGGVRFTFARRVNAPVTVDVFGVSQGRRVVSERLVARFTGRTSSFTWNGVPNRAGRRKAVGPGYYFVRFTMTRGGKRIDTRRLVLRRANGRFSQRPDFFRRATCDLLDQFKLERPVFGGPRLTPLRLAYRLTAPARVTVTITQGSRVVRRFAAVQRAGGRTYRLTFPARSVRPGDYRVRLEAAGPRGRLSASLVARRL